MLSSFGLMREVYAENKSLSHMHKGLDLYRQKQSKTVKGFRIGCARYGANFLRHPPGVSTLRRNTPPPRVVRLG
jgi:hypothetical protein